MRGARADRLLPASAWPTSRCPRSSSSARRSRRAHSARSCASTCDSEPTPPVYSGSEDAADRQLRLLHLQPLPAAGRGERRGADRWSATTAPPGPSWPACEFDNIVDLARARAAPTTRSDFGVCADAIREAEVPLLGVCLGHQGIWALHGGQVVHAPEVMHGRLSAVYHDDSPLFAGHSRRASRSSATTRSASTEPLPDELEATAWTSDGVADGRSRTATGRMWGVQFHPESICTECGPPAARQLPRPDRRALRAGARRTRRRSPRPAPQQRAGRRRSGRGSRLQVEAHRPRLRPRAGLRPPLRRPARRLLARQQQGRRALALLVHGRQRRAAQPR